LKIKHLLIWKNSTFRSSLRRFRPALWRLNRKFLFGKDFRPSTICCRQKLTMMEFRIKNFWSVSTISIAATTIGTEPENVAVSADDSNFCRRRKFRRIPTKSDRLTTSSCRKLWEKRNASNVTNERCRATGGPHATKRRRHRHHRVWRLRRSKRTWRRDTVIWPSKRRSSSTRPQNRCNTRELNLTTRLYLVEKLLWRCQKMGSGLQSTLSSWSDFLSRRQIGGSCSFCLSLCVVCPSRTQGSSWTRLSVLVETSFSRRLAKRFWSRRTWRTTTKSCAGRSFNSSSTTMTKFGRRLSVFEGRWKRGWVITYYFKRILNFNILLPNIIKYLFAVIFFLVC